jgi:serine/threonine protein kinase
MTQQSKPINQLVGTLLDDGIEITSLIGEGGMGVAYRARQEHLKRDICVKFMHPHMVSLDEWVARFKREAVTLSRLRSDHIVSVYFVGLYQGVIPYIAMELLDGQSMRDLLNDGDKKDWRWWSEIMIQVTDTLAMVHAEGIIHRDLKPDNIFICDTSEGPVAKILDFGLCTATTSSTGYETLTKTEDVIGSLCYMAPECFTGAQYSPAVDIYALGCIFHEALVGKPPFMADTSIAIAVMHTSKEMPPIKLPEVSPKEQNFLTNYIRTACHKVPDRRFQDCITMSDCLSAAARDGVLDLNNSEKGRQSGMNHARIIAPVAIAVSLVLACIIVGVVESRWQLIRSQNPVTIAHDAKMAILTKDYSKGLSLLSDCLKNRNLSAPQRAELLLLQGEARLATSKNMLAFGLPGTAAEGLLECFRLYTAELAKANQRHDKNSTAIILRNLQRALTMLNSTNSSANPNESAVNSAPFTSDTEKKLAAELVRIINSGQFFRESAIPLLETEALVISKYRGPKAKKAALALLQSATNPTESLEQVIEQLRLITELVNDPDFKNFNYQVMRKFVDTYPAVQVPLRQRLLQSLAGRDFVDDKDYRRGLRYSLECLQLAPEKGLNHQDSRTLMLAGYFSLRTHACRLLFSATRAIEAIRRIPAPSIKGAQDGESSTGRGATNSRDLAQNSARTQNSHSLEDSSVRSRANRKA